MLKCLEVSITPYYICRQLKRKTMDNNIPKGCKPFDLEAARKGEPVVTRDGRPYKFGSYNPDSPLYCIVGWIGVDAYSHSKDGKCYENTITENDLFMAAKTQKVWVNLWVDKSTPIRSVHAKAFQNEQDMINDRCVPLGMYFLKTIETEVEL